MKSELTQIREGNRRAKNWRILAGVLALVAVYSWLGKSDSDARLDEVHRIQFQQHNSAAAYPVQRNAPLATPIFRGEI